MTMASVLDSESNNASNNEAHLHGIAYQLAVHGHQNRRVGGAERALLSSEPLSTADTPGFVSSLLLYRIANAINTCERKGTIAFRRVTFLLMSNYLDSGNAS